MSRSATPLPLASQSPDLARNAREYESFWENRFRKTWTYTTQGKLRRFRQLMRRHGLLDRPGASVFDQGFGLGLMLFCFSRDTAIAGLELSDSAVEAAARDAQRRGFARADLRRFVPDKPYPPEWQASFDLVISSHVLEHCVDPRATLASLLDLLKPGGIACLVVPINEAPGEDLNHFHWFTPQSLTEMAVAAGLEPMDTLECDRLWAVGTPIALARQRRDSLALRLTSLAFNVCTAILPNLVLEAMDRALASTHYQNRQFFLLARKPSLGAAVTASR